MLVGIGIVIPHATMTGGVRELLGEAADQLGVPGENRVVVVLLGAQLEATQRRETKMDSTRKVSQ